MTNSSTVTVKIIIMTDFNVNSLLFLYTIYMK
jgi:hypothetical protein